MKKLLLLLICLSVSCCFLPTTQAQPLDNTMWGTNGRVEAIARSGNTIYIGGLFTHVGPNTGSAVLLNGADGKIAESPQLQVVGPVHTIVPDGKGGWYMGGGFTSVQQLPRRGLAHILPDGSVDPNWSPVVNGTQGVFSLAVAGNRVYVGGTFDTISGQYRRNIAALDATTGQLTPWNPRATGTVSSIAVSDNLVYAGGDFFWIGERSVSYLAAIDATTGLVTPWYPGVSGAVRALAISGSTLYVGGSFITVGQELRANLAAFDLVGSKLTDWNPGTNAPVKTLMVSGNTLYAGGFFTTIGGQSRSLIAALDVTTGQVTSWNPQLRGKADSVPNPHVTALAIAGNRVYASGNFTWVGTQPCDYVAAIDAVSGLAVPDWNVPVNDVVTALGSSGQALLVGGRFTSIGWQSRKNIAALDATTGKVKEWNPGADARVYALATGGSTVYAAGAFASIGGQPRRFIAALDTATGQVASWNAYADFTVTALAVAGRMVYAGGKFGSIGGRGQAYVAALDAATGKATSWSPEVNGDVDALAVTERTIYIGGQFTTADRQTRNRIAALNAATGRVTAWNPNANAQVLTLAVAGNTIYAGGRFSTIGGQNRNRIAALDATTGQATSWNPQLYDYYGTLNYAHVAGLAVMGTTVYAGGSFHSVNRQPLRHLAAIAANDGKATAWDPGLMFYLYPNAEVKALLIQDGQLHVGGDFSEVQGRSITNFAVFGKKVPAPNLIRGIVYEDYNENCTQDAGEKGIANAVIVAQPGNYFASTDSTGEYTLAVDAGSYTIGQVIGPDDSRFIRQVCPAGPLTHTIRFTGAGQISSSVNFANQVDRRPNLSVSVASNRRRRCFTNVTTVVYCNKGFGPVAGVKVHVKLPEQIVPVSATARYTLDRDKNLVFDLGTLAAGACGSIQLTDSVVCNAPSVTGLTQCTRAWITPSNTRTPGADWDNSDIALKARCGNNGRVRLGIYNTGTGNMADSSAYRIYLDTQLAFTRHFKLAKGEKRMPQAPTREWIGACGV